MRCVGDQPVVALVLTSSPLVCGDVVCGMVWNLLGGLLAFLLGRCAVQGIWWIFVSAVPKVLGVLLVIPCFVSAGCSL